jgi:hypothetical protein
LFIDGRRKGEEKEKGKGKEKGTRLEFETDGG